MCGKYFQGATSKLPLGAHLKPTRGEDRANVLTVYSGIVFSVGLILKAAAVAR